MLHLPRWVCSLRWVSPGVSFYTIVKNATFCRKKKKKTLIYYVATTHFFSPYTHS